MRAVRLTQVGKPLENADVPVPEIETTEVLIRVAAAGICPLGMRITARGFPKLIVYR